MREMSKNKRGMGNVWAIVGLVAAIGIIALMLGVYVYVLATFAGTGAISGNPNATAAVNAGTNALLSISGWLNRIAQRTKMMLRIQRDAYHRAINLAIHRAIGGCTISNIG
jgi:hypothetical protein